MAHRGVHSKGAVPGKHSERVHGAFRRSGRSDQVDAPSPARLLAYECLESTRKRDAFARNILDRMLDESDLDGKDKAFATRLVLGVISTSGTLDSILNGCMRSPRDVNDDVRTALRIAAYEMLFMDKAAHAAVDQGVRVVRSAVPKAAGLANAVLRKVASAKEDFPFGDPDVEMGAFSTQQGFPLWMTEKLAASYGAEDARDMIIASNEPAPVFIAVNSLRTDDERVIDRFEKAGAELVPVTIMGKSIPGCYWMPDPDKLHRKGVKDLLSEGSVLVSDAASQTIVQVACETAFTAKNGRGAQGPLSALELCCGRGTKTILLQDRMHLVSGMQFCPFIAVDNVPYKVEVTEKRARLFDARVDAVLCADVLAPSFEEDLRSVEGASGGFDLVFLDAPCSGTGTLRRHPEIRWRMAPDDIIACARLELALLCKASALVAAGGVLVYSTCSAEPEEDELVIAQFMRMAESESFEVMGMDADSTTPMSFHVPLKPGMTPTGHPYPDSHFCTVLKRY